MPSYFTPRRRIRARAAVASKEQAHFPHSSPQLKFITHTAHSSSLNHQSLHFSPLDPCQKQEQDGIEAQGQVGARRGGQKLEGSNLELEEQAS